MILHNVMWKSRPLPKIARKALRRSQREGPFLLRIPLVLMKPPLSRLPSMKLSLWDIPDELLGIVPMTVIRSITPLLPKGLKGFHVDVTLCTPLFTCEVTQTSSYQRQCGMTVGKIPDYSCTPPDFTIESFKGLFVRICRQ